VGGIYAYSLTVSVDGSSCTTGGTVTVCEVQCAAAASTASGLVPLAVNFTSTVDSGVLPGPDRVLVGFRRRGDVGGGQPVAHLHGGRHAHLDADGHLRRQRLHADGTVYADPYDLSFYDDLGRARLCANSITGEFCWTILSGASKGTYTGWRCGRRCRDC